MTSLATARSQVGLLDGDNMSVEALMDPVGRAGLECGILPVALLASSPPSAFREARPIDRWRACAIHCQPSDSIEMAAVIYLHGFHAPRFTDPRLSNI